MRRAAKSSRQGAMRRFGLRGNQEAARVLVEAMHDAGPPDAADPGEARAAMRQQRVDQRPLGIAGRRMHDHSGRLVDDDQMRILEADIERDRLRFRLGGFGFRQPYGDDLRRGWRAAPGRAAPFRRLGRRLRRGRSRISCLRRLRDRSGRWRCKARSRRSPASSGAILTSTRCPPSVGSAVRP